ncbi:MAG: hypothetical protein ACI8RP_000433 [Urechidicola sp.]|jgi:hypothetical protein
MESKRVIHLGGERISVGGFIELLACTKCNFKTQRLILQSDTDMVYMGVVGLTDLKRKRIVITHLSRDEWKKYKEYVPAKLEGRINQIFNVDSFKYFNFEKLESEQSNKAEFGIFCPNCSGVIEKDKHESFDEFIEKGGDIITLDEYKKE